MDLLSQDEGTAWQKTFLAVFLFSCYAKVVYVFFSRSVNYFHAARSTRFWTDCPEEKGGWIQPGEEPHVTVQICTYNEGQLTQKTIDHACSVDWPANKLTVQVCDDSTASASIDVIAARVAHWRECGVNISRLTRPERVGFKAGSLRHHFDSVRSDFVAHFDADHLMEPDFLRRAIPHFYDKEGAEIKDVGLVQAPWSFSNMHDSILVEAEALALDIHFAIEQAGRCAGHGAFGFNGTGGIWRREAVQAAGGWSWESVTEDLDLAYKARMQGYRFVFVRDMPQSLEVPASMLALIQQKNRWTKGFLQVFRHSMITFLRSPALSPMAKVEMFLHLTESAQYTGIFIFLFVNPNQVMNASRNSALLLAALWTLPVYLLCVVTACYTKVPGTGEFKYYTFFGRTKRLFFAFPMFAMHSGISLFATIAIIEGLFSNDATFLTTPKKGSQNAAKRKIIDDVVALTGIMVGIYRLAFFQAHIPPHHSSLLAALYYICSMMLTIGMFWVNCIFLLEKYRNARATQKLSKHY